MAAKKPNLLILALLGISGWFLWKRMQQSKVVAAQRAAINTTGAQYVLPPDAT